MSNNGNPIPKHIRATRTPKELEKLAEHRAEKTALFDPKIRKLRRQQMVLARAQGIPAKKVGEMFNLTQDTVRHEMKIAEKDGTIDALNEQILLELVPEAIGVYLYKMREEKDAFVAKDVLKHLRDLTLRKDEARKSTGVQYSVEAYMQEKKQLPGGQVVNVEQRIKGEAAKQFLEQGNLDPAPKEGMSFINDIVVEKDEDE